MRATVKKEGRGHVRKIIFQMLVTLDGFFEGPNREIDWHVVDEEFKLLSACRIGWEEMRFQQTAEGMVDGLV